jgi:dienelactone hydrolase
MRSIALIIFLLFTTSVKSQNKFPYNEAFTKKQQTKQHLDTSIFREWNSLGIVKCSNDGKYIGYLVKSNAGPQSLIIKESNSDKKIEISDVGEDFEFTKNANYVLFNKMDDTFNAVNLKTDSILTFTKVQSYKYFNKYGIDYILYKLIGKESTLGILNLNSGSISNMDSVKSIWPTSTGNFVLSTVPQIDGQTRLFLVSLPEMTKKEIWAGKNVENVMFSQTDSKIAFFVKSEGATPYHSTIVGNDVKTKEEAIGNSIWLYEVADNKLKLVIDDKELESNHKKIKRLIEFTINSNKLILNLIVDESPKKRKWVEGVNVWSYQDVTIQPLQPKVLNNSISAVLSISSHKLIEMENNETVQYFQHNGKDFGLITRSIGNYLEANWNNKSLQILYIINFETGERMYLNTEMKTSISISPNGQYLVGYNENLSAIYSYEIKSGIERNIGKSIISYLNAKKYMKPVNELPLTKFFCGLSLSTWLDNDYILLDDEYDLWKVDLSSNASSKCVTFSQGRQNEIVLNLVEFKNAEQVKKPLDESELYLKAFNKKTKEIGFYRLNMKEGKHPELLTIGNYNYDVSNIFRINSNDSKRNTFILVRESSTESQNVFISHDLQLFREISEIHPEDKYYWPIPSLKRFTKVDGLKEDAILYLPFNFNPSKRYPVIIHYYEQESQKLNQFPKPQNAGGNLEIAWFCDKGYIVFIPDIHYKIGQPGMSAVNSIVGAASYLKQMPWVDTSKIGLQGHSFGGYETNFTVTQTKIFAAAVSSSGPSNFVSGYLSGKPLESYFIEQTQNRIGSTLWAERNNFINNSPVFYANKVTTPILTVANRNDGNVPFLQGIEWYIALRRLGKRVWMLEYDGASHGLVDKDYVDYVLRTTQFFNHYLKGDLAPIWMTRGIPAHLKGIDEGFEFDNEIKTPGPGLWPKSN